MSLFSFNPFRSSEELTPTQLREAKMMAWLRTLLRPMKYMTDLFLDDYCKGSNAPAYNSGTAYVKYDRVRFTNQGVYELKVATSTGVAPEANSLSKTNWNKVLNNFIGADERVRYNCQLIVFEYALNRWFNITAAPYAYVSYVGAGTMGTNYTDLYFPLAVYNTLGLTNVERFDNVNDFFKIYAPAGQQLQTIITY
jgi:hypothetical protein